MKQKNQLLKMDKMNKNPKLISCKMYMMPHQIMKVKYNKKRDNT